MLYLCCNPGVLVLQITVSGTAVPMQVDGEPWEQQPGTIAVSHSHTATLLATQPHC